MCVLSYLFTQKTNLLTFSGDERVLFLFSKEKRIVHHFFLSPFSFYQVKVNSSATFFRFSTGKWVEGCRHNFPRFFSNEFLPSCDERTQVDSSRRDQTRKNFIGTNPAIFWGQRHTKQDVRNEPKMGIKISYVGLCWLMLLSTFVSIRITQ